MGSGSRPAWAPREMKHYKREAGLHLVRDSWNLLYLLTNPQRIEGLSPHDLDALISLIPSFGLWKVSRRP